MTDRLLPPIQVPARPEPRTPVTWSVPAGGWQADPAVRASDGLLSIDRTLSSAILGQTVSVSVLVPASYLTSGVDYPVVWHLHGLNPYPAGQNNRYAAGWYPQVYGAAIRSGIVREHITVLPNGFNRFMWIDDYQGAVLVEQFLLRELLPWVQAQYRVLTEPRYNVLTGFSMGARAAAYYAFKRPDLFGGAATFGAPFYDADADFAAESDVDQWGPEVLSPGEDYSPAQRARWLACSPQGWLHAYGTTPRLRINYGAEDGLTDELNEAFMALLEAEGVPFDRGDPITGAGHNAREVWTSSDGQAALAWMETVFSNGVPLQLTYSRTPAAMSYSRAPRRLGAVLVED